MGRRGEERGGLRVGTSGGGEGEGRREGGFWKQTRDCYLHQTRGWDHFHTTEGRGKKDRTHDGKEYDNIMIIKENKKYKRRKKGKTKLKTQSFFFYMIYFFRSSLRDEEIDTGRHAGVVERDVEGGG